MSEVLEVVEAAFVAHFGHRPQRASVSFVGVDPVEVLRFEPVPGERSYVTLGMSRHPMTGADEPMKATSGPRAELVLDLRDPTDSYAEVWRRLAVLAAAPAVEGIVYAAGMSLDLGEPIAPGTNCTGVVVAESAVPVIASPDGPVDVWQAIPATRAELAWCRARGSAALRERWTALGVDLLDLERSSVPLE